MRPGSRMSWAVIGAVVLLCSSAPALSGVHLWRITEAFSNSDGTIQFVEMTTNSMSAGGEIFLQNQTLTADSHQATPFIFPANLTMATANKHLLLATTGFAALPGAPVPDYTIPSNFFSPAGDRLTFAVYDTWTFGAIPTDGVNSLNKNEDTSAVSPAVNSPTNLFERTGSVSVVTGPPAVPDGTAGTQPLTVSPLAVDGSRLRLSFDTAACTVNAADRHILYGQKSGFPPAAGGILTPMGAVCNIGGTSPYDWLGTPNPTDGFNLIWILMVTTDTSVIEGSWGENSAGTERRGPGANGSSGICANDKSIANACGH